MKSQSCCNIIQAVKVHRCCVLYAICIPNCWSSEARAVMNNITSWIWSARPEGRRGQMVTEIVSPHLVTSLPVRSQPGICVSLYWCCPSQLSLYFSVSTSGLLLCLQSTPVSRATSSQLSFSHKFLPIIARSGHSQEQWLNKIGWNSVNWSRKSENRCSLCNVATLSMSPLSSSTSTFLLGRRMCEMFPTEEQSRAECCLTPHPPHTSHSPTFYIPAFYVIHYRRANDTLMFHIWLQQLHFIYFPSTIIVHFFKIYMGKEQRRLIF